MTDVAQVVPWERVTVFVSSTFNDMHAERDYLIKMVFPDLHDWCDRRRLRLVDVDLRWGVTETDATHNKNVVQTCLSRIDDCRPFFICFVGQRRGWVPMPKDVPEETLQKFPALLPHVGKASVTEMEFLHAVLHPMHGAAPRDPKQSEEYYNPAEHAFFYLRDPSYMMDVADVPAQWFETYANAGSDDPVSENTEQERWRREVIPGTGRPVHDYTTAWHRELTTPELALTQGRLADFQHEGRDLSEVIIEDLKRGIEARFPNHVEVESKTGSLQHELDQQEQFLFVNSEGFISRGDDFAELNAYVQGDSRKMFVLTAEGGMGKSMLLANWLDRCRTESSQEFPDTTFHFRFVGQSDDSTTVSGVQRSLLTELQGPYGKIPDEEIPTDPGKLASFWREWLPKLEGTGQTVIVIDALNQLATGLTRLDWLPQTSLPDGVKIIVSFRRGAEGSEEQLQKWNEPYFKEKIHLGEVEPFEHAYHRRALVNAYLGQYLKELDDHLIEQLISVEGAGNPLFLKVVLSELRVFGSFEQLPQKINNDFGTDPISAFRAVLRRLASDPAYGSLPSHEVVPAVFAALACSRGGLTTSELADIVCRARGNANPTQQEQAAAQEALLIVLRQERPFLARRDGRHDFFYESFKSAAREACLLAEETTRSFLDRSFSFPQEAFRWMANIRSRLCSESSNTVGMLQDHVAPSSEPGARTPEQWHCLIADHYGAQPNTNRRRLSELPWHLTEAGRQAEVEHLLTDFDFLQAKVEAFGPQPLIEDYDLLHVDRNEPLGLVQGALTLSASILAREPAQLASQLLGRLLGAQTPAICQLLVKAGAPGACGLRPMFSCLTPPGGPLIRTLEGHAGWVNSVALHADGRRAVSAGGILDNTLKVWDLETGECLRTLEGHTDWAQSVALHTDGRRAVSASHDNTLKLWDMETGDCLRTLEGHTDDVDSVALHVDGRRAVSVSRDNTLKVWDLETGDCLRTIKGASSFVALHGDGRRAVSAGHVLDRTLKVWDLETGECLRTLEGHTGCVESVALHADGRRAVSASGDETLKVWDLETGLCLRTLQGRWGGFESVALHADGRRLVSAGSTLKVWDLETGECLRTLEGHPSYILSVALHADGRRAVSASRDGTLKVWDLETGHCPRRLEGHAGSVTSVTVHADGRRAVSGGVRDNTLKVWDLETGECLRTLRSVWIGVEFVALHADGRRAVSASADYTLKVWDLETGERLQTLEGHTHPTRSLALHADGRRVVSAAGPTECGKDHAVRVWDLESSECLRTLEGHTSRINSVALHADGRRAVSASVDKTLKVWDLETGVCLRTLEGHTDEVRCVALHADGRHAVSASVDYTLKVWDLETGDCLRTLEGHTSCVESVTLHADDRRAVSASLDKTLRVWDLETGVCLHTLEGHTSFIASVALHADGRRAISASYGKTLRIWDLETGLEIASFTTDAGVTCCAIAPNGDTVVAGDGLGHMYFLRLEDNPDGKPRGKGKG